MNIQFVDRSENLTQQDRELASCRLRFALSRFGPEIQRITVITDNVSGPRGGPGKRCLVRVRLRRRGFVEAAQEAVEFGDCFAHASDRIGRSVARKLELQRRFPRPVVSPFMGDA